MDHAVTNVVVLTSRYAPMVCVKHAKEDAHCWFVDLCRNAGLSLRVLLVPHLDNDISRHSVDMQAEPHAFHSPVGMCTVILRAPQVLQVLSLACDMRHGIPVACLNPH